VISVLVLIALVLPFLLLEAFFSGSETAFVSANRAKILRWAKEKNPRAILARDLLAKPEILFSTSVIGTTLCMSCSTTISTLYVLNRWGANTEWLNVLILTPVILIFGEFIPKMIARSRPDTMVLRLARPLTLASLILYPLTRSLGLYARILKVIVGDSPEHTFSLSREEIKAALPASRGTDVTHSERLLIERILEFGKITVKEMLRPLIEVIAIEESQTLAEAVQMFNESGHSRLPVYSERVDRIVGVIQGFDCLRSPDLSQTVKSAMQPALFVPESKPLDELLGELKSKPMAICVNEYGGASGIITMEDVMEEIVGEIEDEYDEPPKMFRQISANSFIVNARMEIFDLREILKIPIPEDDDYQTLGGYLLKKMQKIPKKWDSAVIDGVEYVIQAATDRSIEEVYIIVHKAGV
jgi:putative hemolysin